MSVYGYYNITPEKREEQRTASRSLRETGYMQHLRNLTPIPFEKPSVPSPQTSAGGTPFMGNTPWSTSKPKPRVESFSLFNYATPAATNRLSQQYAQMVGGQTEELRKQQAAREAALRQASPEFQSRYGQQAAMPEEYQTAIAGAAPQLSGVPSYKEFALSKGYYQQGRDFMTDVMPGVRQRLGYTQDPSTGKWITSEQARQQEQQMLAELPPYMRNQYLQEKRDKEAQRLRDKFSWRNGLRKTTYT
jgi:hypothetical protein